MRLEKIKLAGFKSFIEPTTIPVANNLVGIVGPNGCGKSNVIDAVRWVLGEISAKHLRGETMSDVIFNGSSSRKPVSVASVELVFNNQDNRIGGEFAKYASISIKRQVSRNGQSIYLLNGSRCRRKDITDIFLGTGVGSRSYAIIEQGMISRLVEAKPEELREYLEEAAGVSKYKDRRRDTESRMRHTRENLARVEDVQDEVGKQLSNLKRQAKKAETYKALKAEQRRLKQQLLALRWQNQEHTYQKDGHKIKALDEKLKELLSEQKIFDGLLTEQHHAAKKQQGVMNKIQGDFYAIASEISKLEQTIKHARADYEELLLERCRLVQQTETVSLDVSNDRKQLERITADSERAKNELSKAQQVEVDTVTWQKDVISSRGLWQTKWDQINENYAKHSKNIELQSHHIKHLEQQNEHLDNRLDRILAEQKDLSNREWSKEVELIEKDLAKIEFERDRIQKLFARSENEVDELRQRRREAHKELSQAQGNLQNTEGKISSLEVLQRHSMSTDYKAAQLWFKKSGMVDAPRLAQSIETDPEWETAVETALGPHLEAICLDQISKVIQHLDQVNGETIAFFQTNPKCNGEEKTNPPRLTDKITSPWNLNALLSGIYCAESIEDAKTLANSLSDHESVITREGVRMGPGWVITRKSPAANSGILKREKELKLRREQKRSLELELQALTVTADQLDAKLRESATDQRKTLDQLNELKAHWSDQKVRLSDALARNEISQQRTQQIKNDLAEINSQMESNRQEIYSARESMREAEQLLSDFSNKKELLLSDHDEIQKKIEQADLNARNAQAYVYKLESKIEALKSTQLLTEKHLIRIQNQSSESFFRLKEIESRIERSTPTLELELKQLEEYKIRQADTEKAMQLARQQLDAEEDRVTELAENRIRNERRIEGQRELLETARIGLQTTLVRRQSIEDQLQEMNIELDIACRSLPPDINETNWEQSLRLVSEQIERMGAVNLTAVEEYGSQQERMDFLNRQHQDISESLRTLEQAISKIDRESRTRFNDTFDKVNAGLKQKFPKLFGGGEARLALTDEKISEAGITVIARPPGKRTSSIHLLSGGEKALTAVALVFSIFELNPAPFCLLDEVDAPLDDANVGRYSELVQEMSERIQFLFVTHNKVTMEIAEHLTGITMNEPGVSRLVAIDLAEAVKMAV